MEPADTAPRRRRFIDWARGLAVLIMIGAHALDAWTRGSLKSTVSYQYFSLLGGFAAPLFLWLAGVSLALSASRALDRGGTRTAATAGVLRRAAEIFILAFLFRIQAFVVSPGSWLVNIFRVDILNVMGISMAAAGMVWGAARSARSAACLAGVLAAGTAMATPIVRNAGWVDGLPLWIQWHLRPFGDHTTFTLLPWAGFVFAGTAAGALLASWRTQRAEQRGLCAFAVAGGLLIWLGWYTASRPSLYAASSFWTSSPTFFAIRSGVLLLTLAALYMVDELWAGRWPGAAALERFGRNSLFIYWIHVELVYGYATWLIHGRLPLWGTAVGYVLFAAAMYGAITLRDRVVEYWRVRYLDKRAAGPVPA